MVCINSLINCTRKGFFSLMNCKLYVNCVDCTLGYFLKHDACFVTDLRSIVCWIINIFLLPPAVKKTFDKATALRSSLEFQGGRLLKAWKINEHYKWTTLNGGIWNKALLLLPKVSSICETIKEFKPAHSIEVLVDQLVIFTSILESLSKRRFWATGGTGSEHLARQDSGPSQIFKLIVCTSEKKLNNIVVVVRRQLKEENSSIPLSVHGSKTSRA